MNEELEVYAKPVVTLSGLVLVVRDDNGEKWRFPGLEVAHGEDIDRTAEKGLEDLLELEVQPHQLLDAVTKEEELQIYVHAEAEDKETEGELEAKWVDPSKLGEYIEDADVLERKKLGNFLEKLKKMPTRGEL